MPQRWKGTVLWNTIQGGFSESVYGTSDSLSYNTMKDLMTRYIARRFDISWGPLAGGQCRNPIKAVGLRIEDELVPRDTGVISFAQSGVLDPNGAYSPASNASASTKAFYDMMNQNLDLQLAYKLQFKGSNPRQIANIYYHGVSPWAFAVSGGSSSTPIVTAGDVFQKRIPFSAAGITAMNTFAQFMCDPNVQLGFRYLNSPWDNPTTGAPGSSAQPTGIYYNTGYEMVELQWQTPPPSPTINVGDKVRVVLRQWSDFRVLNGRWTAECVSPQQGSQFALRIRKKVRAPQVGLSPGKCSLLVWGYFKPQPFTAIQAPDSGAKFCFIASKKLGRNFFEDVGRQKNRAS